MAGRLHALRASLRGVVDFDDRMRRLSDLGDRLEAFAEAVDVEIAPHGRARSGNGPIWRRP